MRRYLDGTPRRTDGARCRGGEDKNARVARGRTNARVASTMPPNARVLNVAEKPSVAKEISRVLSNGAARVREGATAWNKVWEFEHVVRGRPVTMVFTSVTGHLSNFEFAEERHRRWASVDPRELLVDARVVKRVPEDKRKTAENVKREARGCDTVILWLDCDREGENIAFEVLEACRQAKPGIMALRARFSALGRGDADRALANLVQPNEYEAKAVDMRMELDLRLGAAFTRFNTLALQRAGVGLPVDDKGKSIVSYGPCQFPTLGFIVQRKWDIDAHVSEDFWSIKCSHAREGTNTKFEWSRGRLFDRGFASALHNMCARANIATVIDVDGQESRRWPPHPLNTIEMQKRLNRTLRISPEQIMKIAEDLYNDGFISYPRTETDKFPADFNYDGTLRDLHPHPQFGFYVDQLVNGGRFRQPPGGGKDDKAHPPIYPTKLASEAQYQQMRAKNQHAPKVYEFVVRHFLATCSHPAIAMKTHVDIVVAGETFRATGVMIRERNYLDIYGPGPPEGPRLAPAYDNWGNSTLPLYTPGEQFVPALSLHEGQTRPPDYLSEVDLLSLMESHMIGTDATQAQHIEKVVGERGYARKVGDNRLTPTQLGEALVLAYDRMGVADMWLPTKRAKMEADVDAVAKNRLDPNAGLRAHLQAMLDAYDRVAADGLTLTTTVGAFMNGQDNAANGVGHRPMPPGNDINGNGADAFGDLIGVIRDTCPSCQGESTLRSAPGVRNSKSFIASCAVPHCMSRIAMPSCTRDIKIEQEGCGRCQGRLLTFKFSTLYLPVGYQHMQRWSGCIFCDAEFQNLLRACQAEDHPPARESPARRPNPPPVADGYGRGGRGRGSRGGAAGRRRSRAERDEGVGGQQGNCFKCGEAGHWSMNCPN